MVYSSVQMPPRYSGRRPPAPAHTSPSSMRASCLSSSSILWFCARTTVRRAFISASSSLNSSSCKTRWETELVSQRHWAWKMYGNSVPFWLTYVSLCPLWVSIRVFYGHAWLWCIFLRLFGSRGRCGTRCRWGGSSPRVLRGERWFASEGVSVLGGRCCVATAQRDQQGGSILSRNPLISQESRLQASCVGVKVSLKKIWLWKQKR